MTTMPGRTTALQDIIGDSIAMRDLRDVIRRVAPRPINILIQGPTGSGKELVARGIHGASGRTGPFVAFNICAVPESVFESMLFGHVRGAFTGAVADSPGYLIEADRGTLFLDEIGGLPASLQAKLLRVLETREFRPVGASRDRSSDFRLVASTNEPLSALVEAGRFRADLAYRLSAVVIEVPPLRDRPSDIPLLAQHFVSEATGGAPLPRLDPEALRALAERDWPGNVRELRNAVERAVILADGDFIGPDDLRFSSRTDAWPTNGKPMADLARRRLWEELRRCDWEVSTVAERLGVHWTTVYRRMRKFGITRPREGTGSFPPPDELGPSVMGASD
jgi:DNA-binding NtrC family response regulator